MFFVADFTDFLVRCHAQEVCQFSRLEFLRAKVEMIKS